MIAFQENIISKLVPFEFLPSLVVVVLDEGWLRSLSALRDGDRPAERRQTDQIDVHRKKGVLATDLIGGTPIAMEIKVVVSLLGEYLGLTDYLAEMGIFTYRMPSLARDCRSEDSNVQILHAHELQNRTRGRRYDLLSLGPFLS
jgi:inositol-pentakisphosphate 2-kinase